MQIPDADTSQDDFLTMLIGDADAVIANFLRGRRLEQDLYTEYYSGNGTRFLILKQRPVLSIVNVWIDYNGYFGQGVNDDGSLPFADATTLQPLGSYDLVLDETITGPPPAAWDSTKNYFEGDMVLSGGNIYECVLANLNQIPPNTLYWMPISDTNLLVSKCGLLAAVSWNWPDLGAVYIPGALGREGGQILGNVKVQYSAGYPAGYIPGDLQYAARLLVSTMRQTAAKGARLQSESVTDYSWTLMNPGAGQPPEIGSIRQILARYREVPAMGGDLAALPSNNNGGWR